MAKRKKDDVPSIKSKPNRTGVPQTFYLDPELAEALHHFMGVQELEPTKTSVFEAAIRMYLEHKGFWPRGDDN